MQQLKKVFIVLVLSLSIVTLFSCATNSGLTDVLSEIENAAKKNGDAEVAAIFGVAASVSKASEDITPENEYYIGRSVAASILSQYKVYEDKEKEAYVNKIAQALLKNSDAADLYDGYHVKLLDSKEMNAFATSGGHIFITRGMLECATSEDALAAAIAHEISHIQLKHSASVIKSSRYTDVVTKTASAALTLNDEKELAGIMDDTVGDAVNKLVSKGYSKAQEFDADCNAIKLMNAAGYNPNEMITLLNTMEQVSGKASGGMFKTHPSPQQRIKKVEFQLEQMDICPDTTESRYARFDSIMK